MAGTLFKLEVQPRLPEPLQRLHELAQHLQTSIEQERATQIAAGDAAVGRYHWHETAAATWNALVSAAGCTESEAPAATGAP